MATIVFTDRGGSSRHLRAEQTLARAARAADRAPRPAAAQCRWAIAGTRADLVLAGERSPAGLVAGGSALHHACVALAGLGAVAEVERRPEPDRPELLARLRLTAFERPTPDAVRLHRAIALRPTLAEASGPVPADVLDRLRAAAAECSGGLLVAGGADGVIRLVVGPPGVGDTWLGVGEALSAVALAAAVEGWAVRPEPAAVVAAR
ncbi:hypothetical protein [Spirilliplanes yamanashiensis]|uniref:Uncharacterized protein n=1 Tax=Spirilliplanes yamanashiensis TaxID=42233 RepID=A0A8J4DI76_9ACTN|nr:hypothetical protein [Spirilliplanes yamanashiensis]MDP9817530.1 hypothetical protein [Spirilliplanes yamanashiensis]GIJ02817.1 hypothetical protein Sya03_21690 [Spirilliplanes yamanashiensis]